jgi:hypothetical protein
LPPFTERQRRGVTDLEGGFADVPGHNGVVAVRGGGERIHLFLERGEGGEDLLVLAHQLEDLQPLALVGELGPGPQPRLSGVPGRRDLPPTETNVGGRARA